MKRIFTVLAATLLLTAAMAVTASASDYDSVAEDLSAIGVFRGTSSGFELDRAPRPPSCWCGCWEQRMRPVRPMPPES